MTTKFVVNSQKSQVDREAWVKIGLTAGIAGAGAVLIVQALAIAIWPEIALFKPLDSYARSALFTLVPVVIATGLLAWLVSHRPQPVQTFLRISAVVLVLSIIPDYVLPVPHRTLLASSVTALLHVVAGVITVLVLVTGYQGRVRRV